MSAYQTFFLNTASSVIQYELIDITHPQLSVPYYIVRNNSSGLTVTLEDSTVRTYIYHPLQITPTGAEDDLEQKLKVQLGDLGLIIPNEIDNIAAGQGFATKPQLVYRTYRSDDLSAPMYGPVYFEINSLSFTKAGATFEARAPRLNLNQTGEIYRYDRFPMLRAFLP